VKAVIVAAGQSSRMGEIAGKKPKCLLEVGGRTILQRALATLGAAGVEEALLVVGYEKEQIAAALTGEQALRCRLQLNPFYAMTNNMASLWFARPYVAGESFLYLHGDLLFHPAILARLLETSDSSALTVAPGQFDAEAMKVELGPGGYLAASSKAVAAEKCAGEWIGLARFVGGDSSPLFDSIEELLLQGRCQDYDTAAFSCLARRGTKIAIVGTEGLPYVEVDTSEDLARARALFPAD
jgi:choline kinase